MIDRLYENGVRFSNAYSACLICIPARRSLTTGTSPHTHGDRTFREHLPMDVDNILPQSVSIADAERIPDDVLILPNIPYGLPRPSEIDLSTRQSGDYLEIHGLFYLWPADLLQLVNHAIPPHPKSPDGVCFAGTVEQSQRTAAGNKSTGRGDRPIGRF
jgi:hypothetical protein